MSNLRELINKKLKQYIQENIDNGLIFGNDYSNLLDNIENSGLNWSDPKETLDNRIDYLRGLSGDLTLYRLIFVKDIKDINIENLGHHYVEDVDDFHDDMINYLYQNAKKQNKNIKETDLYLVKVETNIKNIDFSETILTFSEHPNETEITIKDPKEVKIIEVDEYYQ